MESISKQFCYHWKKHSDSLPLNLLKDNQTQKGISYTKKQKLMAVSYVTTTCKAKKDAYLKLISKRSTAINLEITTSILRE